MQPNQRQLHAAMRCAFIWAELSHCKKRQVGAVIVKNNSPIAWGYNGTSSGEDNCCEDEVQQPDGSVRLVTKPEVWHAEDNALRKLTRSTESGEGATMFVTTAPCKPCATRIVDAGIVAVYYVEDFSKTEGLEYLRAKGVRVEQLVLPEKVSKQ